MSHMYVIMLILVRKKGLFPPHVLQTQDSTDRKMIKKEGSLWTPALKEQAIYMESQNAEFESIPKQGRI